MVLPLARQLLLIRTGQTLRVSYSFRYKVAKTTNIEVRSSLYQRVLGVIDRIPQASGLAIATLEKSLEWKDFSGSVDIPIGRIQPGIYGLILEIPVAEASVYIDDCIRVEPLEDLLAGLAVLGLTAGMVALMLPMVKEMEGL